MNRIGVALAADSAVTIGQDANKIYTSADKLFQLSPSAPIGVMIYGNADFCGLPWETIIKTYRNVLSNQLFDTVEAYGEHLIHFLENARDLFPENRQTKHLEGLLGSLLIYMRDYLQVCLDREAEKNNGLTDDDLPPIIEASINDVLKEVQSREFLPTIDENRREEIKSRYHEMTDSLVNEVFGKLPFTDTARESLFVLAYEMLVRHFFGPLRCGVVLAGFGESQYMPSLVSYELEELVADIPRALRTNCFVIDDDTNAGVVPFAQRDMVESFMEGIQGELYEHARVTTERLFRGTVRHILDTVAARNEELAKEFESVLELNIEEMLRRLFQDWKDQQENYWRPVIEVVASLPKDELAAMAEALVNLTKFRRRVSAVRETVGGPIDVAVITKGDGFVWTQRKHYFDPVLNPRVISRLQKL